MLLITEITGERSRQEPIALNYLAQLRLVYVKGDLDANACTNLNQLRAIALTYSVTSAIALVYVMISAIALVVSCCLIDKANNTYL